MIIGNYHNVYCFLISCPANVLCFIIHAKITFIINIFIKSAVYKCSKLVHTIHMQCMYVQYECEEMDCLRKYLLTIHNK